MSLRADKWVNIERSIIFVNLYSNQSSKKNIFENKLNENYVKRNLPRERELQISVDQIEWHFEQMNYAEQ